MKKKQEAIQYSIERNSPDQHNLIFYNLGIGKVNKILRILDDEEILEQKTPSIRKEVAIE
jgi:hypothetical protein